MNNIRKATFKCVLYIIIYIIILFCFTATFETNKVLSPFLMIFVFTFILLYLIIKQTKIIENELNSNVTMINLWFAKDAISHEDEIFKTSAVYAYTNKPIRNNDGLWICRFKTDTCFEISDCDYKKLIELGILPVLSWEKGPTKLQIIVKTEEHYSNN